MPAAGHSKNVSCPSLHNKLVQSGGLCLVQAWVGPMLAGDGLCRKKVGGRDIWKCVHERAMETGMIEPKGWSFMLGIKEMAAAVPRGWTIFAEEEEEAGDGLEKIIGVPQKALQYQVERARHLARYVRELLARARDVEQEDREVWVKLERRSMKWLRQSGGAEIGWLPCGCMKRCSCFRIN